jgi:hypothetical protein
MGLCHLPNGNQIGEINDLLDRFIKADIASGISLPETYSSAKQIKAAQRYFSKEGYCGLRRLKSLGPNS